MAPITSNGVPLVNTIRCDFYAALHAVDLKNTRIERLKAFARQRGVLSDPSGLGALIGKKPNQVYNLLHGVSSFGEKVARSIEEAAGLPHYWLDQEVVAPDGLLPAVAEVAAKINALPPRQRDLILNVASAMLNDYELLQRERAANGLSPTSTTQPASHDQPQRRVKGLR